jgi:DNA-directed RNA polymerase specialized sigma24 family protein
VSDTGLDFEEFVARAETRLRHALVASLGLQIGAEATCEALAYAWEHWRRVGRMEHPVPYLYRVGRSAARRHIRPLRPLPLATPASTPWVEPALEGALRGLTESQRTAVVLVHSYQWTHQEVAELLGVERTTVQNHVERGLTRLRDLLEVKVNA